MLWTSKIPSLSLSSHPFSKPLIKVQLALACSVVLQNGFSCLLGPGEITGDSMGEILLLKSPGYKFSLVMANTRKGDVGLTCKFRWLGFCIWQLTFAMYSLQTWINLLYMYPSDISVFLKTVFLKEEKHSINIIKY